jgi:hypothetical protein
MDGRRTIAESYWRCIVITVQDLLIREFWRNKDEGSIVRFVE